MAKEIPGFYYDPTTERYFRLRPGEKPPSHCAPPDPPKPTATPSQPSAGDAPNLVRLLEMRGHGALSFPSFQRQASIEATRLPQRPSCPSPSSDRPGADDHFPHGSFLAPPIAHEETAHPYLIQWNRNGVAILQKQAGSRGEELIAPTRHRIPLSPEFGPLSGAVWGMDHVPFFMISLSGGGGCHGRVQAFRQMDESRSLGEAPIECVATLVAYRKTLYTCSWRPGSTQVGMGVSQGSLLADISNGRILRRNRVPADVLLQSMDHDGLLYQATRGGKIFIDDVRCAPGKTSTLFGTARPAFVGRNFYGSVNPVQLRLLHDGNYLLASYSNGQVLLWDRRTENVVSHFGRQTLAWDLDDEQNLLYTMNEKKEVLLWDLWHCRLRNVSAPLPVPGVPQSLLYSSHWPLPLDSSRSIFRPSLCVTSSQGEPSLFIHPLMGG